MRHAILAKHVPAQFDPAWTRVAITEMTIGGYEQLVAALRAPHNLSSIEIDARQPRSSKLNDRAPTAILGLVARSPTITHATFSHMTFFLPEGAERAERAAGREVNFNSCKFSADGFAWTAANLGAAQLYMKACSMTPDAPPLPASAGAWAGLRALTMDACSVGITYSMFHALAHVPLESLSLVGPPLPAPGTLYVNDLPPMDSLRSLELHCVQSARSLFQPTHAQPQHDTPISTVVQRFPNLTALDLRSGQTRLTEADAAAIASLQQLRTLHLSRIDVPSGAVLGALLRPQLLYAPTLADVALFVNPADPEIPDLLMRLVAEDPFLTTLVICADFSAPVRAQLAAAARDALLVDFITYTAYEDFSIKTGGAALAALDPMQTVDAHALRVFVTGPQRLDVAVKAADAVMLDVDEALRHALWVSALPRARGPAPRADVGRAHEWWREAPRDARHFRVVSDIISQKRKPDAWKRVPHRARAVVPYVGASDAMVRALRRPDRDIVLYAANNVAELRMPGNQVVRAPLDGAMRALEDGGEVLANMVFPATTLLDVVVERALMCATKPVLTREEAEQVVRDCDPDADVPDRAPTMHTFASGALAVRLPALLGDLAAQFANPITVPNMADRYMRQRGRRPTAQDRAPAIASRAIVAEVFYKVAGVGADVVPADEAVAFLEGFELVFPVGGGDRFVYRNSGKTPALLYRALALMLARNPTTRLVESERGRAVNFVYDQIGHASARVAAGRVVVDAYACTGADACAAADAAAGALADALNALLLSN